MSAPAHVAVQVAALLRERVTGGEINKVAEEIAALLTGGMISISQVDLARLLQERIALAQQVTELQAASSPLVLEMRRLTKHAVDIKVVRVPLAPEHRRKPGLPPTEPLPPPPPPLPLPKYQSSGAVGFDLQTTIDCFLTAGSRRALPTGLALELPDGYKGAVLPRSGVSLKHGVDVIHGSIDYDFRGEVHVVVHNISEEGYRIVRGDRIAQLVIVPVAHATLVEVGELSPTARNAGGFGSTGK